jgi:hypothetical protein
MAFLHLNSFFYSACDRASHLYPRIFRHLAKAVFPPILLGVHCQTITGQPSVSIISVGPDLRTGRWGSRLAGSSAAWAPSVA